MSSMADYEIAFNSEPGRIYHYSILEGPCDYAKSKFSMVQPSDEFQGPSQFHGHSV